MYTRQRHNSNQFYTHTYTDSQVNMNINTGFFLFNSPLSRNSILITRSIQSIGSEVTWSIEDYKPERTIRTFIHIRVG